MLNRISHDNRGQELAEYAISFFVLFLLLLGIIEFGIIMFSQNSMSNVAREGARWAVVRRSDPVPSSYLPNVGTPISEWCDSASNAIVINACSKALALDQERIKVTVTRVDRNNLRVRVEYSYDPFFGLIEQFFPSGLTLGSQSNMRLE